MRMSRARALVVLNVAAPIEWVISFVSDVEDLLSGVKFPERHPGGNRSPGHPLVFRRPPTTTGGAVESRSIRHSCWRGRSLPQQLQIHLDGPIYQVALAARRGCVSPDWGTRWPEGP